MHISYQEDCSSSSQDITLRVALINITSNCTCYMTTLLYIEIEVVIKIYKPKPEETLHYYYHNPHHIIVIEMFAGNK